MDEVVRAAEIRKVAPIVAIREYYRRDETTARSRKTAALYTGADSIFALTEGNPRIFIGLIGSLLAHAKARSQPAVSPHIQAEQLLAAAQKFVATLRTIPTGDGPSDFGVIDLLRRVANYFRDDAIAGHFKAAPTGAFIVDSNASDALLLVLVQALNAGAIIYVPDDEGKVILTSLRGKKFRLSYLLAPIYGYPIRIGPAVALSGMLRLKPDSPRDPQFMSFDFEATE